MIPVLSASQVREVDSRTIATGQVTSVDLMERAATLCAEQIIKEIHHGVFGHPEKVHVLVAIGMGNNGGDGLVISRLLHEAGIPVRGIRVLHRPGPSADHAVNFQRARSVGVPITDFDENVDHRINIADNEIIIDALFGSGLNAPIAGLGGEIIKQINASMRPVIAIDLPSGLLADGPKGNEPGPIVKARTTLTFEVPKLALLLPDNAIHVGEIRVIPIGLDSGAIRSVKTPYHVLEGSDLALTLPVRPSAGHKGTFGHVLIIAGSEGKYGAAILAARAALRSGTGLVTMHLPQQALAIIQIAVPEAMCSLDAHSTMVTEFKGTDRYTALAIGPGIGTDERTQKLVKLVIQEAEAPLVMDADALNVLAKNPTWIAFLPPNTILTPHPGEFDRLVGTPSAHCYDRLMRAREFAKRHRVIVILKGAWTAICDPHGEVFFNPSGNSGMAKGGSGDMLTGLIAGLLAQGIPPLKAAMLGTYLHGSAGDLAAKRRGMDGMTPGDIVESLPEAWQFLRNASEETFH